MSTATVLTDRLIHDERWNILRDNGGGGVAADPDYTDPANFAAIDSIGFAPIPKRRPGGGGHVEEVELISIISDSSDDLIARGSMTLDVVALDSIERGTRQVHIPNGTPVPPRAIVDSAVLSIVPMRKFFVRARGNSRFQIAFQNIASPPGSLDRIRFLWRVAP